MSDIVEIHVTCPRCDHSHIVEMEEDALFPNPAEEKLYRLSDLERILGLSRRTLLQRIYDKKLRAFKPGADRRWHIREADLVAFRRSRE